MNVILAVVGDTWQQSRQQVVFIIMLVLMLLFAIAGAVLPKTFEEEGGERGFGLIFNDEPTDQWTEMWNSAYVQLELMERERPVGDLSPENLREMDANERQQALSDIAESQDAMIAKQSGLTSYERSVQAWLYIVEMVMITVSMWLFIAACAGYFPGLLAEGAIDAVIAKPVHRFKIFIGKYLGGLALFTAALVAFHLLLFAGVGLRTGVWHAGLFQALPFQVFLAATFYAIMSFLGIWSRSVALPMILGYLFYLVVDTFIGFAIGAEKAGFITIEWLSSAVRILRATIPNFSTIKDWATLTVLDVPAFDWQPFQVAFIWLVVSLGLGYWIFHRRDY